MRVRQSGRWPLNRGWRINTAGKLAVRVTKLSLRVEGSSHYVALGASFDDGGIFFPFWQLITGTNAADWSADINFLRHGSKKMETVCCWRYRCDYY